MLDFANKYASNIYSQNGEDGIIAEAVKRMGLKEGLAIEFGGADGYFCSNIRNLEKTGWDIVQYDVNPSGPVIEKEIDLFNVNEIGNCDILSIDVDGKDWEIWKAYNYRPQIVVIEINSSLRPIADYYDPEHGSSYCYMVKLGRSKDYFLLCHTGNLIFVKQKAILNFPEFFGHDPLIEWNKYFNKSWL